MIRTATTFTLAAAVMAASLATFAQADEARVASATYTKTLSTRFNYVRSTDENAPASSTYAALDFRNVVPLARSISCPLTSCGLAIDADMSASAGFTTPTDFDSIYLCVYVDGVRRDCSWNAVGQRITGARVSSFMTLGKGTHAIQIKGKSFVKPWSIFQATARYSLLGP